ncbi:MAG: DUF6057 family protein [Planctomycetia bacterium]|nr:DUF6057 family protein [Planctomycetia bacterium]
MTSKKKSSKTSQKTPESPKQGRHFGRFLFSLKRLLSQNFFVTPLFQKQASFLLFCFFYYFWAFRYRDFLYVAQNYDLFPLDKSFLIESLTRVGGLLLWLTSFFIQFFYYPLIGGAILAFFFLLLQRLSALFFRLNGRLYFLSLIPSILIAIMITQIGYYLFDSNTGLYRFSFLIGLILALSIGELYSRFQSLKGRSLFGSVAYLLFYPALGFFAILAVCFCIMKEMALPHSSVKKILRFEIGLLILIVVPLFWFRFYSTMIPFSFLFIAGLVEQTVVEQDFISYTYFWTIISLLFILYLTFFFVFVYSTKSTLNSQSATIPSSSSISPSESQSKTLTLRTQPWTSFAILLLFFVLTLLFSFHDRNFFIALSMAQPLENGNWNELLRLEKESQIPFRPLVLMRLLSYYRKGEIGERLFERSISSQTPYRLKKKDLDFRIYGDRILYYYGFNNMAMRGAMNNYVVCKNRSIWTLKTLTLTSLVNNEPDIARRYLRILQKTIFHRKWANRYLNYLDSPLNQQSTFNVFQNNNEQSSNKQAKSQSAEQVHHELLESRRFLPPEDFLEKELLQYYLIACDFLTQNYSQGSINQQEMQLAFFLMVHFPEDFWTSVQTYLKRNQLTVIPKAILEALIMISEVNQRPFDFAPYQGAEEKLKQFHDYAETITRFSNERNPRQKNKIKQELIAKYSDTFWYYVAFVNQNEF